MPTILSKEALIFLWCLGLLAWSSVSWFWFFQFYGKIRRKQNDVFTGAFMLAHLSQAIFLLFLVIVIPTGRLYDELILLDGSFAILIGIITSGLVVYEVYMDTRQ